MLATNQNFNVSSEQAVQQTSSLEGLAGLAGMLAKGVSIGLSDRGGGGGTARDQDALLNQGLVNGLVKVQALDNAGRISEARQLERTIGVNYAKLGGNLASPQAQELIRQFTGRDGERFGFSEDEIQLQNIMKSNEFQSSYAASFATHPDVSEQERIQIAMGQVAVKEANSTLIQQAQFEWTANTQAGFTGQIGEVRSSMLGGLALKAQRGETVTPEDIQQSTLAWNNYKLEVLARRPQGVTSEQWAPVQAQLDAVDENLKYWAGITNSATVDANAAFHLQQAVDQLSNIGPTQKNILKRMVAADPDLLFNLGALSQAELFSTLKTMIDNDVPLSPGDIRDQTRWDDPPETDQSRKPQEIFQDAQRLSTIASIDNKNFATSPELREEWGRVVVRGMSRMYQLANEGQWLSPAEYSNIFNSQFLSNVEALKTTDPTLHGALVGRMHTVLTRTGVAVNSQLASRGRDTSFEYNMSNGQFRMDPNRLRATLGSRDFNTINSAVSSLYGGDWDKALRDQGRAFTSSFAAYDMEAQIWFRITDNGGVPPEIRELSDSLRVIQQLQDKIAGGSNLPDPPRLPTNQTVTNINKVFDGLFGGGR